MEHIGSRSVFFFFAARSRIFFFRSPFHPKLSSCGGLNQEGGAAVWTRPVKAEAVVLGHLVDHAAGAYQTWLTRCLQDAAQVLATDGQAPRPGAGCPPKDSADLG